MSWPRGADEEQRVVDALFERGWTVERDYIVTWRNRNLRADAVLLLDGVIVAVVEVKIGRVSVEDASPQLTLLADALGAPLALLWLDGQVFQVRDLPGVVRGHLSSLPTPEEALQLLGPLQQLFMRRLPACRAVVQAVHDWRHEGAARTGNTYLPAIEFYAAEHDRICMQVPLAQCVLIGGMLEGILRETAISKEPMNARKHRKATLDNLIIWGTANSFISAGVGAVTPDAVRKSRNALHPNVFIRSPLVSAGIARNAAHALAAVVAELNTSV